jgi:hypothetical protein
MPNSNNSRFSIFKKIGIAICTFAVLLASGLSLSAFAGFDPNVFVAKDFGSTFNRLPNQSIPLYTLFDVTGTLPTGFSIPTKKVFARLKTVETEATGYFNSADRTFVFKGINSGRNEGFIPLEVKLGVSGKWEQTGWRIAVGNPSPEDAPENTLNGPVTDLGKYLICNDGVLPLPKNSYITCYGLLDDQFVVPKKAVYVSFRTPGSNEVRCNFVGPIPYNVTCPNINTGLLSGTFSLKVGFAGVSYSNLVSQAYAIY